MATIQRLSGSAVITLPINLASHPCIGAVIGSDLVLTAKHGVMNKRQPQRPYGRCGALNRAKLSFESKVLPPSAIQVTMSAINRFRKDIRPAMYAVKEVMVPKEDHACGSDIALLF